MRIAVTGAGGQLGIALRRVLHGEHELYAFTREELDVTDADRVHRLMQRIAPEAVIHAAAYTRVDLAEREQEEAYRVNAFGSRNIAAAAQEAGAKLVYISTDYVFDGAKGAPYNEFDPPRPINVYGRSKLAGEQLVAACCHRAFIVRTSWLYGEGGHHFVRTILNLARQGKPLKASFDEIGSPTYALDLAVFISRLIDTSRYGLYHASNTGYCSRYEWVRAILDTAGRREAVLEAVPAREFGLTARRPANSAMDDLAIRLNGLPRLRSWRDALQAYMSSEMR